MKKPIIGIIPTFNAKNETNDPYKDIAIFSKLYEEMITECGGIPIGLVAKDATMYPSICDGYLWPGGNKIEYEFYPLIEDAIKNKKPLLGICLGAQVIATYFNILEDHEKNPELSLSETYDQNKIQNPYLIKTDDPLHDHEVTKDEESINHAKHSITIQEGTLLFQIYGKKRMDVVSLHSAIINRTSSDTVVSAQADDKVVEAVEYTKDGNHILGCLFHPEIIKDTKVFQWLIDNAKK